MERETLKREEITGDFSPAGGEVKLKDTTRVFHDDSGHRVEALSPINLTIKPGELVSLVGPSGCGKSTLLRLIAGLDIPDSGNLSIDGQPIEGTHHERGLVFQDPTLFPWLTVEKNIAFGFAARGIYHRSSEKVKKFISLVGLDGF